MIYLYRCPIHGGFEVEQPMNSVHKAVCPKCKAPSRRIFVPLGVIWGKGMWEFSDRLKDGTKVENGLGDEYVHNF